MKNIFQLEKLIKLRQHFHKFPEGSFLEFETSKRIKEELISMGVDDANIKTCAKTGWVVDIKGKKPTLNENQKIIAIRADMDALEMAENNPDLEYRSVTNHAHMCGHDGHMTLLLGGISLLLEVIEEMPANRTARFLFQPAEEKFGGAKFMVKEGCLEGVSEVWGLHNLPLDPPGQILVKSGPIMAAVSQDEIIVTGKGGHSSNKLILKDPVLPSCELIAKIESILETEFAQWNNKDLVFSVPKIITSTAPNVFPDQVQMEGTIRSFDDNVRDNFLKRVKEVIVEIEEKRKVKIDFRSIFAYPMVNNDAKLTKCLQDLFGNTSDVGLPLKASEDFSEFSNVVPGCFFMFSIGSQTGKGLHVNNYNFNDGMIETGARNWLKIIRNRLDF